MSLTSPSLVTMLAETVAGCLDEPSLHAIARLELDARTKDRLDELADKANEGQLTAQERAEYQSFIDASDFLALAQFRARTRLGSTLTA